ncbi:MAG: hypothetical protein U0Q55_10795 [Vicinamibacterales bacterium]
MSDPSMPSAPDTRPYLVVWAAQLVLTLLAVLVARVEALGTTLGIAAVMLLAIINAGMVAVYTMGIRRDGRAIVWLAVVTVVLIAGLLVWPAWDISQRGRHF